MRIGLLTNYLPLGNREDSGIGQHYRILADALAQRGDQVHVVYADHDAAQAREDLDKLAPAWTWDVANPPTPWRLPRSRFSSWPMQLLLDNLRLAWAASRVLADASALHNLEVIETHSYGAPAIKFLRQRKRPSVITRVSTTTRMTHSITQLHARSLHWHSRLERLAMTHSDSLLTHTRQHRDLVCEQERLDPACFSIVPHGLPDPGPLPSPAAASEAKVEFLFVGRFELRKGIDVLLAAIPRVATAWPDTTFTLAGSIEKNEHWDQFVKTHPDQLGGRVRALGRVSSSNLKSLYRRCSILVAPSRYESFGLIYPEAMGHGKPVIGCRAGGIPEVVNEGVTGLLANPGDVESLVDCMSRLAGDATLRARLGAAGRREFLGRFSADILAQASVDCYRRTIPSTRAT